MRGVRGFVLEVGFVEFVQPLRSLASIDRMKKVLRQRNIRDYALFILGIYTGLRISDLLKLKVEDVSFRLGPKLVIRDQLALRERKTGKAKIIILNKEARSALRSFLNKRSPQDSDPIFVSKKPGEGHQPKPIGRWQAHHILNQAAREAGIRDRIGTHTLRKTFGYHSYRKGVDLTMLQKILNHSSPAVTLAYIGFTQDEINDVYIKLRY
jgi:integrase